MSLSVMPDSDYKGICDQTRRLTGKSGLLTSDKVVSELSKVEAGGGSIIKHIQRGNLTKANEVALSGFSDINSMIFFTSGIEEDYEGNRFELQARSFSKDFLGVYGGAYSTPKWRYSVIEFSEKIVKHIQRGFYTTAPVTLTGFTNIDKMVAIILPSDERQTFNLTTTKLDVGYPDRQFSYQVIEFY